MTRRDTLHAKAYRLFHWLPWTILLWHGFFHGDKWLAAAGLIGMSQGLLVGWEYPPPTVEELEQREHERGDQP